MIQITKSVFDFCLTVGFPSCQIQSTVGHLSNISTLLLTRWWSLL